MTLFNSITNLSGSSSMKSSSIGAGDSSLSFGSNDVSKKHWDPCCDSWCNSWCDPKPISKSKPKSKHHWGC